MKRKKETDGKMKGEKRKRLNEWDKESRSWKD